MRHDPPDSRLKISLFGELETVSQIHLSAVQDVEFERITSRMRVPLAEALVDPFFYHRLRDPKIMSVSDLAQQTVYSGLLDTPKNQIEIWHRRRKVAKIKMRELGNDMVLFPLFDTLRVSVMPPQEKGIYFRRREIGLAGIYELVIENFRIDNLKFILTQADGKTVMSGMRYMGQDLKIKKKDTLQTFLQGFEIK